MRSARIAGLLGVVAALVVAPVAVTVGSAAAAGPPAGLSKAQVASLSANADRHVIVLFKDQYGQLPAAGASMAARRGAVRSAQAPVMSELHTLGAKGTRSFTLINAVAATVSGAEADRLAADPAVGAVVPDRRIAAPRLQREAARSAAAAAAAATPPGACPADPSHPQLAPEALQVTHTAFEDRRIPQAQNIATGAGVKVALIADGLDINNPDFIRADGQHVFVDYKDFSGDGPNAPTDAAEAFGDASGIAAQGRHSYDLSDYVNTAHPLPAGCNIRVLGMAPGASLVGLKAFRTNSASTSAIVQAIDYAVTVDHVDVINESFGSNPYPDRSTDPVSVADDAAVAAGATVVADTGDAGTTNTVSSPGDDPNVIDAAATTTFRSYAQETAGGFQLSSGRFVSNNISSLSGGGTTQSARTPDILAPGDLGWALCSPDPDVYLGCTDDNGNPASIQDFGGTSQSTPLTSGEAALVIEAYGRAHHGARPSPALVKSIITSTATDLGHPTYEQGSGLINSLAAVQAALSVHDRNGAPARTGSSLLVGPGQLSRTAAPGTPASLRTTVTNLGAHTRIFRTRGTVQGPPVTDVRGSVRLDLADTAAPAYIDPFGIARTYVKVRFHVPAGMDRLDASIAAAEPADASPVRIILLDPHGTYTAYSIPQGNGNFGHVDVRFPPGGTWTAVIAAAQKGGFTGPVHYEFATSNYRTLGSTSPSVLVLRPGRSGRLALHTATPAEPGDRNARLELQPLTGGLPSVVPVTLRSTITPRHAGGAFSGLLTGGNGRSFPGQSLTYDFDVPRGLRDLAVGLRLGGNPDEAVSGYLVDPHGQLVGNTSNIVGADANGNPVFSPTLQLYQRAPTAGRWQFDLVVANPISGTATSQPFAGRLQFNTVAAAASGVPNSRSVRLPKGKPVPAKVKITNTGVAPESFFTDARLAATSVLPLVPLSKATGVAFPDATATWRVPTESSRLDVTATSAQRIQLDVAYADDLASGTGGTEQTGPVGNSSSLSQRGDPLGPGVWFGVASQVGPFGGPAPEGTADLAASVRTAAFDPAVTSSTGDGWLQTVRSPAPAATPVTLRPGRSATITVTITPTAAKGSVVHGTLFVDDVNGTSGSGDELVGVPYAYTVS